VPAPVRGGTRVLDIPCGAGPLTWAAQSAGFRATGCDLFAERVRAQLRAHAGRRADAAFAEIVRSPVSAKLHRRLWGESAPPVPDDARAVRGDMEAGLPFGNGSFEIVLCIEGIEHVSDRNGLLRELRRVTKRGGRLLITTPNLLSYRARLATALTGFRTLNSWLDEYSGVQGRSEDGSRVYHGHAFMLDYNEMRYSLHHAGFRIVRLLRMTESSSSRALGFVLFPFVWAMTKRACFLGKRKFEKYRGTGRVPEDAPNPADEIFSHLMSKALLHGRLLAVEAVAV